MLTGSFVTWTRRVELETDEEVWELLRDLSPQELDTAYVWWNDWYQPGAQVLQQLITVFGD